MILLELPAGVRRTVLQDYLKLARPVILAKWPDLEKKDSLPREVSPVKEFLFMGMENWRDWCRANQPEAARYLSWLEREVFSRTNQPDLWDVILCADYSTMCAIICWMKEKNYLYQKHKTKESEKGEAPPEQSGAMDSAVLLKKLFRYDYFRKKKPVIGFFAKFFNDILHISICPYCNINWITSISVQERSGTKNKSDDPLLTAQLDHYFPKSLYPYLSLTLFNLVPSCSVCNQRKTSIDTMSSHWLWYPYEAAYCGYVRFQLNLADYCDLSALAFASDPVLSDGHSSSLVTVYTQDGNAFTENEVKPHEHLLKRLYQSHTADVQEIIFRAFEYNQCYHTMARSLLPKPVRPPSLALRIQEQQQKYLLLGEDRHIRMRHTSLGKLKRDIAGQLLMRKQRSEEEE